MMSQAVLLAPERTGTYSTPLHTSTTGTLSESQIGKFSGSPRALQQPSPSAKDGLFDTSLRDGNDGATRTIVRLAPSANSTFPSTSLLAEWNGCVTSIQEGGAYFSATLKGVVGEGVEGEEEDAVIPIDDVSEGDVEFLAPGNFFRLCVIHEVLPSGQPRRYSQVVFRRLPAYRQHDLNRAEDRARMISQSLRVE